MGTNRSIVVEVDGQPKTIMPGDDYDAVVADLRSQGRSFQMVEDVADSEGESYQFKETVLEPTELQGRRATQYQDVPGQSYDVAESQPQQFGDIAVPSREEAQARGTELALDTDAAAMVQGGASAEKAVRRIANGLLSQRPDTFLPEGTSALGAGTFMHFEPTLEEAMSSRSMDAEDLEAMAAEGKETPAYRAFAEQRWKLVHDVHQKHGQPVIRSGKISAGLSEEGIASGLASVTENFSVPVMLGFDSLSTLTAGRQAMGAVSDALASPAEEELMEMGVLLPMSQRLKAIGEESPLLSALGSLPGLATAIPRALMKGGLGLAGSGGGSLPAQAGAAGVIAGAEAMAEGGVEVIADTLQGKEPSPMSGAEVATRAGMGVLGAGAGALAGRAGSAAYKRLRKRTSPGGDELRQIERLTGERGTQMGGGLGGVKPAKSVQEAHDLDLQMRADLDLGDDPLIALERTTATKVGNAVNTKVAKDKATHEFETNMFYESPQGKLVTKPVHSILAMLKEERGRMKVVVKSGTELRDAPMLEPAQLDKAIADFEGVAEMNARDLDVVIRGVDEAILTNRKQAKSTAFMRRMQAELRTVRDQFEGNAGTGGRRWGEVKSAQHDQIVANNNAKKRLSQQPDIDIDLRNPESISGIVKSMKTLGDASSTKTPDAHILDLLDEVDPTLLKQYRDAATWGPAGELASRQPRVPYGRTGLIGLAMDPRTFRRLDPLADLLSNGMHRHEARMGVAPAMVPGAGSERAEAALTTMEREMELAKQFVSKAAEAADKEEASNE